MTHKQIKRFQMEGTIKDESDILRLKAEYIRMTYWNMRQEGYVPLLDLDPSFSTSFDAFSSVFSFKLTVHGVFIGTAKAKKTYGITGNREVPLSK